MPIINMNIRTLKTVKETIENEDKVLINTNIPEVKNLLSEIKTNLNNMQGMDASLDRIISMFIDVSANLSFDLAKLESFLTTQINNYELTEEEAVEEINVILGKMKEFTLGDVIVNGKVNLGEGKNMTDIDWNRSPYVTKESFRCQCGGKYCNGYPVEVSKTLIEDLNNIRLHFNKPMIVTSGIRCGSHNSNIGGASGSRHTRGLAADFYIEGVDAREVAAYVSTLPNRNYSYTGSSSGYAQMDGVVHYDVD